MKTLQELNVAIEAKSKLVIEKMAEAKSAPDEQKEPLIAEVEALNTELEALDNEHKDALRFDEMERKANERIAFANTPTSRPSMPNGQHKDAEPKSSVIEFPSNVSEKSLTSFKSGTHQERVQRAMGFGQWFLASQFKDARAIKYCQEQGIELKAANEGINSQGGALVPIQFDGDLIDLREKFGVFRRNAKISRMSSDTKIVPRRTGGLTPYFVAENTDITESQKGWDNVTLTARKLAVLTKYSNELREDAIIDVANDLASEIAYAFALKEDQCGFLGDGTSTYGGIVGVSNALLNLSATRANIAGVVVASGNLLSEITLADFNAVKGRLPEYANTDRAKWYMSQATYSNVAEKLMLAAGGVTAAEIAAGRRQPLFMGYPVEVTQILPSTDANDQIVAYFGDLYQAALFGDRRVTTIAMSEHVNFAADEMAIRGTERFDINVHDVGNAAAAVGDRVAGPLIGLLTAAA